jgi:murein DD-endopeptidase MepM/ murein hydrolase activator NlpD
LHEGKPFVSASGSVELWHSTCWSQRDKPVVTPSARQRRVFDSGTVATIKRNARSARRVAVALGGLAFVAAASYGVRVEHGRSPHTSVATISVDPVESPSGSLYATEREEVPPGPDLLARYPIGSLHDTPLDDLFPSLDGWIHPVVGTENPIANYTTGMFGAGRDGIERDECKSGHCGTDISGPIGRPIVAVADGTVVRVEHSEMGRDGRSGRYVRIEHVDGVLTSYMHLDTIRDGIKVGMHVRAGDKLGTLGKSGTHFSAPHLHFALEIPKVPGTHGDNTNTRYIDPAPFLVRALITEDVDRTHPLKPAF